MLTISPGVNVSHDGSDEVIRPSAGDASCPSDTARSVGNESSSLVRRKLNIGTGTRWLSLFQNSTLPPKNAHPQRTVITRWWRQKKCWPASTGDTGVNPPPPCAPGHCGPAA